MLTLYIILWFLVGFVSLFVAFKITSDDVTTGDILFAVAWSFGGLLCTIAAIIEVAIHYLEKKIW